MVRRQQRFLSLFLCALATVACGGGKVSEFPSPRPAAVTISPSGATVTVGSNQQFVATVGAVVWSVNGFPGGNAAFGTIDATGMYQAPAVPPQPQNVATVRATSVANAGVFGTATVTVVNPTPQVDMLSPSTAVAGYDLEVTMGGSGFAVQSVVMLAGQPLTTTLVSQVRLTATVPANLLGSPGSLALSVSNPAPGGGTSATKSLLVLSEGMVTPTDHPQVARYSLQTPEGSEVEIEFGFDESNGLRTWTQPAPAGGGQVDILVAGMRAFSTYNLRAVVELADGVLHHDRNHSFTTGGPPLGYIPPMNVSQPSGLTPNPGVELVHIVQQPVGSRIFVIDLEGNVLWFYEYEESLGIPTAFTVLPNGNFLAVFRSSQASLAREIDLTGNIVREVTREEVNQALVAHGYEPLAQVSFHHDALVSPNGNFLLITNYRKEMMVDGQLINVLGDAVVEIDDELNPVWVWSAFDHLDINRHPLGWFDPRWNWNHTNAILYSQADRNLILSMNNQVWILKLDYQDGLGSGKVLWRLGWQGDFTLLNGTVRDFAFSQHGPSLVEDRAGFFPLAVFDNGDARVLDDSGTMCGPETEPCYSRAVIFELDENLRTARVAWEQRSPALSPILGNAQVLPNGNVEYVVGTTNDELGALVQEVTQEQDPKVVWKLFLPESLVYRARRLPSLYPGVQW